MTSSTAIIAPMPFSGSPGACRGSPAIDFQRLRRIELLSDVGGRRVGRVHRPQQRHGGELARLVDADAERVLLGDVDLDPRAALGNDAAGVQFGIAFGFDDEIDAGRAVQLADDDALGAVDDELAAADHDRHVAEIDFFLDAAVLLCRRSQTRNGRP